MPIVDIMSDCVSTPTALMMAQRTANLAVPRRLTTPGSNRVSRNQSSLLDTEVETQPLPCSPGNSVPKYPDEATDKNTGNNSQATEPSIPDLECRRRWCKVIHACRCRQAAATDNSQPSRPMSLRHDLPGPRSMIHLVPFRLGELPCGYRLSKVVPNSNYSSHTLQPSSRSATSVPSQVEVIGLETSGKGTTDENASNENAQADSSALADTTNLTSALKKESSTSLKSPSYLKENSTTINKEQGHLEPTIAERVAQSSRSAPDIRSFLSDLLEEAEEFMPSSKEDYQKYNKFLKTYDNVDLYQRKIKGSQLQHIVQKGSNSERRFEEVKRLVGGEEWLSRWSKHQSLTIQEHGTASFDEFRAYIKDNHSENEKEYTPNVVDAFRILDWNHETKGLVLGKYHNITMGSKSLLS